MTMTVKTCRPEVYQKNQVRGCVYILVLALYVTV